MRSEFAGRRWEPGLFSADWRSPDDLAVGLDTDDRQLAFAACTGLTRSAGIAGSNSRKRRCSA